MLNTSHFLYRRGDAGGEMDEGSVAYPKQQQPPQRAGWVASFAAYIYIHTLAEEEIYAGEVSMATSQSIIPTSTLEQSLTGVGVLCFVLSFL